MSHALAQLLATRMCVAHRRHRVRVPREPLREEQVPRGPVDVGDRSVAERMEGVETIEACDQLPSAEEDLDPLSGLRIEERPGAIKTGRTAFELVRSGISTLRKPDHTFGRSPGHGLQSECGAHLSRTPSRH